MDNVRVGTLRVVNVRVGTIMVVTVRVGTVRVGTIGMVTVRVGTIRVGTIVCCCVPLCAAGHICANFATRSWELLTMLNPHLVAGE